MIYEQQQQQYSLNDSIKSIIPNDLNQSSATTPINSPTKKSFLTSSPIKTVNSSSSDLTNGGVGTSLSNTTLIDNHTNEELISSTNTLCNYPYVDDTTLSPTASMKYRSQHHRPSPLAQQPQPTQVFNSSSSNNSSNTLQHKSPSIKIKALNKHNFIPFTK